MNLATFPASQQNENLRSHCRAGNEKANDHAETGDADRTPTVEDVHVCKPLDL